jgi:hypothetical protein
MEVQTGQIPSHPILLRPPNEGVSSTSTPNAANGPEIPIRLRIHTNFLPLMPWTRKIDGNHPEMLQHDDGVQLICFQLERTVGRVAAEVTSVLVSSQPLLLTSWLSADHGQVLLIISFSPPLRCDLAKPPPTAFPVSFIFVTARGIIFRRTRLPGCRCLRGIRIRSEFRKIRDLESLQSSVSILYI